MSRGQHRFSFDPEIPVIEIPVNEIPLIERRKYRRVRGLK